MGSVENLDFHICGQLQGPPPEDRLALDNRSLWPNGSQLVVNMWGQSDKVRSKVIQHANEWSLYANITFKFMERDAPGDSDIRVAFNSGGSWSYIGTGAKNIPQDKETMNFGWFNDETSDEEFSRVIIHEFGHALGCIHEQASPVVNIPWNIEAVYDYYMKKNGWDRAKVDNNVFRKADQANTTNSRYDPTSIMQYAYPPELTTDGSSAGWNTVLSNLDKTFIMRCYPKDGIQRNTQDGIYLVNRARGDQHQSGVAWYEHFGNNDGQRPDDWAPVDNDNWTWWENGGTTQFLTGAHVRQTVSWNLDENAGRAEFYTRVGFANNDWEKWNVYRDNGRVLYEEDGWQYMAMFWAF